MSTETDGMRELARDIATALGEGWSEDTPDDFRKQAAYIVHTDGRRIFMTDTWSSNGKMEIHGDYPRSDMRAERVEIGVSTSRGAQAIAKEITRRLLPTYDVEHAKVVEYVRQCEERAVLRHALAVVLAESLPGLKFDERDSDAQQTCGRWYDPGAGFGDVTISWGADRVAVSFTGLSPDETMAAFRAIVEARKAAAAAGVE